MPGSYRLWPCIVVLCAGGCSTLTASPHRRPVNTSPPHVPSEAHKAVLTTYCIEPPDILQIDAVRAVPRSNYRLNSLDVIRIEVQRATFDRIAPSDVLVVRVPAAPTLSPINGAFPVQRSGLVNLGPPYGSVRVAGLSLADAERAIEQHLSATLVAPDAMVALAEEGTPVAADYPISLTGAVDLAHSYGRVGVGGLTIEEASDLITAHFRQFFSEPVVTLTLLQMAAEQQITGQHMVGPDGTVTLAPNGIGGEKCIG